MASPRSKEVKTLEDVLDWINNELKLRPANNQAPIHPFLYWLNRLTGLQALQMGGVHISGQISEKNNKLLTSLVKLLQDLKIQNGVEFSSNPLSGNRRKIFLRISSDIYKKLLPQLLIETPKNIGPKQDSKSVNNGSSVVDQGLFQRSQPQPNFPPPPQQQIESFEKVIQLVSPLRLIAEPIIPFLVKLNQITGLNVVNKGEVVFREVISEDSYELLIPLVRAIEALKIKDGIELGSIIKRGNKRDIHLRISLDVYKETLPQCLLSVAAPTNTASQQDFKSVNKQVGK